jgi:hypothetical protein
MLPVPEFALNQCQRPRVPLAKSAAFTASEVYGRAS